MAKAARTCLIIDVEVESVKPKLRVESYKSLGPHSRPVTLPVT
jgi:hypothetical protein